MPSPYRLADAIEYVTVSAPSAWRNGGAIFAIVSVATAQVVGSIGASVLRDGVADVGYWAAASMRKQGLMRDALRMLTSWFLHEGGARGIRLTIDAANLASLRCAEGSGFVRESPQPGSPLDTHARPLVVYSLTKDDILRGVPD